MKKFWLQSLALTLGLVGFSSASAQYNAPVGGLGASAYPVQNTPLVVQSLPQVPGTYAQPGLQPIPQQQIAQQPVYQQPAYQPSVYQQQPGYQPQMQLIANQDGAIYNQQLGPETVTPQVMAPQPSQTIAPQPYAPATGHAAPQYVQPGMAHGSAAPMQTYAAPGTGYVQQGSGCTSCQQGSGQAFNYSYPSTIVGGGIGYDQGAYSCAPTAANYAPVSSVGIGPGASPWFFGGGVLLFNRFDNKDVPLSFFDNDYVANTLTTRSARPGVMPGFEVMAGRYFNCGRNAIQVSYFGVFSETATATRARTVGGDYRSRMAFTYVDILNPAQTAPWGPATQGVYSWFDSAFTHQLERSTNFHNVEVNLLGFAAGGAARNFRAGPAGGCLLSRGHGGCGGCGGAGCGSCASAGSCGSSCGSSCGGGCGSCASGCGPRFGAGPCGLTPPSCGSCINMTWLAGFRYFRFEDNLTYAASLEDSVISRAADDLYYDVNTTNDLFGFQLGSRLDYCLGNRFNFYGNAKAGIFGNHSTFYSRIATEFQNAYLNDTRTPANPNNGQAWLFNESKNTLAFLGELGTGVGVRMSSRWTATVGYRAIFASGVATSVDNIHYAHANYADIRDYDNYGSLVLHGLNIGALYNF